MWNLFKKKSKPKQEIDFNSEQHLSSIAIDKIVDDLIQKKEINITYFPDIVEKQIYKNFIIYFFGLIKIIINSTKIEFLNHEILLSIQPKKNNNTLI